MEEDLDLEFEEEVKKRIAQRIREAADCLSQANAMIQQHQKILCAESIHGLHYNDGSTNDIDKAITDLIHQILYIK